MALNIRNRETEERAQALARLTRRERARAAFGMWARRPDIDDSWLASARNQWYSGEGDARQRTGRSLLDLG